MFCNRQTRQRNKGQRTKNKGQTRMRFAIDRQTDKTKERTITYLSKQGRRVIKVSGRILDTGNPEDVSRL